MRLFYIAFFAILLCPNLATAACPASMFYTADSSATARGNSGIGVAFIGGSCTTSKIGSPYPPTDCTTITVSPSFHIFRAIWPETSYRTSAPLSAGCSFMCQGIGPMGTTSPSCFVRALDGMPVELMEFSIDSKGSE